MSATSTTAPHTPAKDGVRMTHTLALATHPSGHRTINQYILLSQVGRGVHGSVRKAQDTTIGSAVAIKIVDRASHRRLGTDEVQRRVPTARPAPPPSPPSRETDAQALREVAILRKCSSPYIVQLLEVIDDPQSNKIFMVMEYLSGGEVRWRDDHDRPLLPVEKVRQIARDVVCGLQYLHYNGIIHRDLKPANLLWTDESQTHVKISDFGASHFSLPLFHRGRGTALEFDEKAEPLPQASPSPESEDLVEMDQRELAHTVGSPTFFAPELCLAGACPLSTMQCRMLGRDTPETSAEPSCLEGPPHFSQAIDAWALGVTLYCLLFGTPPFQSASEFGLFSVIPWYDYTLPATMGSDGVQIGPRGVRWDAGRVQSAVQEQERISCVSISRYFRQQEGPEDLPSPSMVEELHEEDVDPDTLTPDAAALWSLLDGLLEKDPNSRMGLDEVKTSAWMTSGLPHPRDWVEATDPCLGPYVPIYSSDVPDAQSRGGFHPALKKLRKSASASKLRNFSFGRSSHPALSLGLSNTISSSRGTTKHKPSHSDAESSGSIHLGTLVRAQVDRMRARIKTRAGKTESMSQADAQEFLDDLAQDGAVEVSKEVGVPHSHSGTTSRKFDSLPILGKPKRPHLKSLFPDISDPTPQLTPSTPTPLDDGFHTSKTREKIPLATATATATAGSSMDSPHIDAAPMISDPSSTSYLSDGSSITTKRCSMSSPAPSAMSESKRSLPSFFHARRRPGKPMSSPSLCLPLETNSTSGELYKQRSVGSIASNSPEPRSGQTIPNAHLEGERGPKLKLLIMRRNSAVRHARRASVTAGEGFVAKSLAPSSLGMREPSPEPAVSAGTAPTVHSNQIETSPNWYEHVSAPTPSPAPMLQLASEEEFSSSVPTVTESINPWPHSPKAVVQAFPPASYSSPTRKCARSSTSIEIAGLDAGAFDDADESSSCVSEEREDRESQFADAEEGASRRCSADRESQFADADEEVVWVPTGRAHPASLFQRGPWASPDWSASSLPSGFWPASASGSLRSTPALGSGTSNSTFGTMGTSVRVRQASGGLDPYYKALRGESHLLSPVSAAYSPPVRRRF